MVANSDSFLFEGKIVDSKSRPVCGRWRWRYLLLLC